LLLLALNWWKWAAALPLFAWLVRRVPLTARLRSVGLHAAVALLATTVHLGLTVAFGALLDRGEPAGLVTVWLNRMRLEGLLTVWLNRLDPHLVIYAAIVAALSAREAAWRSVAEATRSARLDEQLARAQLEVPSLQLQPHFLFNALNALAELAHEDREDARRMLRDLRGLLALSFEWATRTEVALGEELDFVRAYAGIQGRRFRGLSFRMHADEDALSARVPPLLLQPLVENAIRHGLGRRGGRVEVRAWREAEALRIDVLDDGGGLAGGSPAADGLGLRNTRARLAHLYGPDQSLEIEGRSEGGVLARLVLPFRTEERAA
jgi:signal transduction histidine kinase